MPSCNDCNLTQFSRRTLLMAALLALIALGTVVAALTPARADANLDRRRDAAIQELVRSVLGAEHYLTLYDQVNRLMVATGQRSAADADAALAAKARDVARQGVTDGDLQALSAEHRTLLTAWFGEIERGAAQRPQGELWAGQARRALEQLWLDYESWIAAGLNPSPLLNRAAVLAGRALGTPNPFAGERERIAAAFVQPMARQLLGPRLSAEASGDATQGVGIADAPAAPAETAPTGGEGRVQVNSASYGANCGVPDDNALAAAKQQCDGKADCPFRIDPGTLGNPAPACMKDFVVRWTCADLTAGGERTLRIGGEAAQAIASLSCRGGGAPAATSGVAAETPPERPIPGEMGKAKPPSKEKNAPPPIVQEETAPTPPSALPIAQVTDEDVGTFVAQSDLPVLLIFCVRSTPGCQPFTGVMPEPYAAALAGKVRVARIDLWQDIGGEQRPTGSATFEALGIDVTPTFMLIVGGGVLGSMTATDNPQDMISWVLATLQSAGDGFDTIEPHDLPQDDGSLTTVPSIDEPEPPFIQESCTGTFSGIWDSNYGRVTLSVLDGQVVVGQYGNDGFIEGVLQGDTLNARWSDLSGNGTMNVTLSPDRASWSGPWMRESGNGNPGGSWTAQCVRQADHDQPKVAPEQGSTFEPDIDRPGIDYKSFDLPAAEPGLCQRACLDEGNCRAWTYVKPGVQGTGARCWLKNAVPAPTPNQCCVSGVTEPGS